ncbi:hypothetical protein GCM10011571_14370 [Marinithermofilum abyssi]|uniref:Uncharacterized protein n=1 Tax=Marinithermofilum abyssi TaxID=1571185 RepID=A0A8J2VCS3_9BACL|nr:hypothetical protein [Marinithermofilum abyssi]GGE14033.1 hypothetical protein GCM10011571_14370 [Marinithermofilum abyssi]
MIHMTKMKIYPLLIVTLTVLLAVGVYVSFFAPKEMELGVSVNKTYTGVEDLKRDADLVVEGKSLSRQSLLKHEGMPFTLTPFQVTSVMKGDRTARTITILETGGFDETRHLTVEHNQVMNKDQHYILFLQKYQGPVTDQDAYVIIGAYQGKFQVDGQRITPAHEVSKGLAAIQNCCPKFTIKDLMQQPGDGPRVASST